LAILPYQRIERGDLSTNQYQSNQVKTKDKEYKKIKLESMGRDWYSTDILEFGGNRNG